MDNDTLKQILLGAPNFVGFIMLAIIQYKIIMKLMNNWKDCENDSERARISADVKRKQIED